MDSRFLKCCDHLGKRVLRVYSPRGKAISDSAGTVQAKGTSMALDYAFESEGRSKQEQNSKENTPASIGPACLPARKGKRPQNNSWSATYAVQWIWGFEIGKSASLPGPKMASHRVKSTACCSRCGRNATFLEPEKNLGSSFENRRANLRAGERITPIT